MGPPRLCASSLMTKRWSWQFTHVTLSLSCETAILCSNDRDGYPEVATGLETHHYAICHIFNWAVPFDQLLIDISTPPGTHMQIEIPKLDSVDSSSNSVLNTCEST